METTTKVGLSILIWFVTLIIIIGMTKPGKGEGSEAIFISTVVAAPLALIFVW